MGKRGIPINVLTAHMIRGLVLLCQQIGIQILLKRAMSFNKQYFEGKLEKLKQALHKKKTSKYEHQRNAANLLDVE